jgi:hypothetical protein
MLWGGFGRPLFNRVCTMPRKPHRLSLKATEALFDRLLAHSMAGWQEREGAIREMCRVFGADPESEPHRHLVFGTLAYLALNNLLVGPKQAPGRRKGLNIRPADRKVIARALASDSMPDIKKALKEAIKWAEKNEILRGDVDSTTHMKRLMRTLDRSVEFRDRIKIT